MMILLIIIKQISKYRPIINEFVFKFNKYKCYKQTL